MGSCCFTPRKSHFLWWYWLVLTAVLGIPMLLAAGYARLRRNAPESDRPGIARASATLFWVSLVLVLLLAGVLVEVFFGLAATQASYRYVANDYRVQYPVTLTQLATDFVLGFAVAGVGWRIARRCRRSWQHVAVAVAASLGQPRNSR